MMIKTEWFAMNSTQHNPTPNQSCWTDELTYKWMLNVQHGYIPYDEYGFFIYFFFFILSHHVIIVIFLHLHQLTKQPTNSTHWPRLYLLHKNNNTFTYTYALTYIQPHTLLFICNGVDDIDVYYDGNCCLLRLMLLLSAIIMMMIMLLPLLMMMKNIGHIIWSCITSFDYVFIKKILKYTYNHS